MDNWVARLHTLLQVAQAHQHQSDSHLLVEYDSRITEYLVHSCVLFTPKHRGPWLPAHQRHEDAYFTGAHVATENLSQDFPWLFPAFSWLVSLLDFQWVKPNIPPWTTVRMPPWAHSSTLPLRAYMFRLSDRSPSTVTLKYVLSTYCLSLRPFHTWLRFLSPHILCSTHSALCLFTFQSCS